jgi:hypothetical protein
VAETVAIADSENGEFRAHGRYKRLGRRRRTAVVWRHQDFGTQRLRSPSQHRSLGTRLGVSRE